MKPGAGHTVPQATGAAQVLYCEIDGLQAGVNAAEFSPAGFFVQSFNPPEPDTEVEVFLRSDLGSITVSAVVVTIVSVEEATAAKATPGFGALFTDLSDSDRTFLARTTDAVKRSIQSAQTPTKAQPAAPSVQAAPKGLARPRRVAKKSKEAQDRAASPTPGSREASRVLMEIHNMLDRDAQRAAWRILGVTAEASVKDAKRAFLKLAKRHHPHVYARYKDPQINDAATRLFIMHKKAYSTFCKEAARKAAADKVTADKVVARPPASGPSRHSSSNGPTEHTARLWNERRGKING